jgi:predicted XRE-type DNA-binding protein
MVITDTSASVLDAIADTPEQATNMRTRSDLAWQIVDTIKDKGWTQEEAAKQSGIANSRMHTLLSGNMDGFSADELFAIAEALQAENKFIYLNEVGKNLALLYQYSGVAASIRAFGGTDQDCVSFAGSDFKRDYGDDLTLQAVNELCIFNLSELMFDFLNNGKEHLIN